MSKKTKIDLESWNRKEHFSFFSSMEEPFFGITVTINCTKAYQKSKEIKVPFFDYYLHKTLVAVNKIENFRYRIHDNEVYIYDQINASSTVLRDDNTFGFSLMNFDEDIFEFSKIVQTEKERVKSTTGLFTREFGLDNLIHFSTLPWIDFKSFSHARSFTFPDSCPKISFGKLMDIDSQKTMSMSIHVHHGLIDGYHVGQFLEQFEIEMNQ